MNFLLPKFTVSEACNLGSRYTCSDKFAPIRDELAKHVSQHCRKQAHEPVQQETPPQPNVGVKPKAPFEPEAPTQVEEATIEFVSSSKTEVDMVTRKVMMISHFVPGA